jgi:hypothetical protein
MRVMMPGTLAVSISLLLLLSGCGYSEDEIVSARIQASSEIQNKIEDALNSCEVDMFGVLMDDGCLEDEFSYGGDFWDCELSRPADTMVDADCVRSELGL